MYQFYVVEIKKNSQGEYEHEVFWTYDQNEEIAKEKGESKYYEIMSRAAVSTFAEHSAILFSSHGSALMNGCYYHKEQE